MFRTLIGKLTHKDAAAANAAVRTAAPPVPAAAAAAAEAEAFSLRFDFTDREPSDLDRVNGALSARRLSGVKVADSQGYLATVTSYDPKTQEPASKAYRYGFDHLVLACEAGRNGDLYTWRIDTAAFPKGEVRDADAFHDIWVRQHPDRVMRTLMQYEFDTADAFVVLHHGKKAG